MAKRLNCATCIYLNMHKKEFSDNGHNHRYGCGIAESGYLPFWLCENRNDIELTTGGCYSHKSSLGLGTMFRFFTENNKYETIKVTKDKDCLTQGKVLGKYN